MATWWSPLSDGIQRLVARVAPPGPDAAHGPATPAADVAPVRAPQAWPWLAPVQRALDPDWAPRLRPNDFAAGLTSHQDPSFRRDLVHEVRPSSGGLVDGLADLVPGPPRTRPSASELTVRPVRTARPEVQRTSASFASDASDAGVDDLTTVQVEPPWLADPIEAAGEAATGPREELGASVVPAQPPPHPSSVSVPAGTSRDIRVQRQEADATPAVVPTATPDASVEAAMPMVPTLARTTADRPAESRAVPVEGARPLPVVAAPPPPRPARPELPTARTLPVLQRSVAPDGRAAAPAAPAPASTEPASSEPSATAPLSGFAEAIDRMSVQTEPEPTSVHPDPQEPVSAGPVVPLGRVSAAAGDGGAQTTWSTERPVADVQRDVTADAAPPSGSTARTEAPSERVVEVPETAVPISDEPSGSVEAPAAPLLGFRVEDVAPGESPLEPPTAQRAAYDDLPVVPVARDVEPSRGWSGAADDVPRLPVATFTPSPPVPVLPVPSASIAFPGDAHDTWAVGSRPNVARTALPLSGGHATPATPDTAPTVARALEAPVRTVPLTGTRPTVVQRSGLEPRQDLGTSPVERVQPLRYESVGATAPTSRPYPSAARPTASAEPSLQRSSGALPAVAPGLVGPGPVGPGPVARGPGAVDSGPGVPVAALPAPGSTAVELEPVFVSRSADVPAWSAPEPSAPRSRAWSEQPLQRLATPAPTTPPARPQAFRSLPFDQMFGGAGGSDADGWTTVDLPVVSDSPSVVQGAGIVQRAVDTSAITTEPVAPEPAATPAPAPAAPAPAAAAPAAPAAAPAPSGADLDEMARRLFDPLSARLRAELSLDRERAGLVADAHF